MKNTITGEMNAWLFRHIWTLAVPIVGGLIALGGVVYQVADLRSDMREARDEATRQRSVMWQRIAEETEKRQHLEAELIRTQERLKVLIEWSGRPVER